MDKTSIGDRMKRYELVSKSYLVRRTPVVIRIDGKAFHTWTKQLKDIDESLNDSPFSEVMHYAMSHTALHLVAKIQNARIAYIQSDEISILLNDWGKLNTDQWFDGSIQKIASVSASIATAYFNQRFEVFHGSLEPAMFDSRVFNIPKEDVTNYFIWRQQDATRNSVNMLGQFYFSHKELQKKNVKNVMDMLHNANQDWNHIDTWKKRGYCVTRNNVDDEIPIFTQDRDYIERHLLAEED